VSITAQGGRFTDMHGRFTVLEVRDPHLIGQAVRNSLPASERASIIDPDAMEWAPLDRHRFRAEPERYRTEYAYAKVGGMYAARVSDGCATHFRIRSAVMDAVWIILFQRGTGRLGRPGSQEPAIADTATGLIRNNEPGTWSDHTDGSCRTGLCVPAVLFYRRLEALLDGEQIGSFAFRPTFDTTRCPGTTIRRMIDWLFAELAEGDTLLANETAIRSFQEHLLLCLLLGLPHSHSERLSRQRTAAAPVNVKRAEEFMRSNAREPLTIEVIASAAGCSVRALQLAFHRFRGATPMAALQRIRLEAAREEMLHAEPAQSLARIAAEHGFSNPSRFAQLFRRTYGAYPSDALKTRHGTRIGGPDISAQVA
jgi:AraC-like DNA-binding protein